MKKTIFRSMVATALLAALLAAGLVFGVLYRQLYGEMKNEIQQETLYLEAAVEIIGEDQLDQLAEHIGNGRVTLIASDGTVLYDSVSDPATMENHLNREEVRSAMSTSNGEASRVSTTIGAQTFYYAVLLSSGNVLRVARTTDSVWSAAFSCIPWLLFTVLIVAVLSIPAARNRTKHIVAPINRIKLDAPLSNDVYEEISPLLSRIEQQNRKINETVSELRHHQDEFSAITAHMREGLVILNQKGMILSLNESATRLFEGADRDYVGQDMLTLNRSIPLQKAIRQAMAGEQTEVSMAKDGGEYQIVASPVFSDRHVNGIVLLTFDITERSAAEQMRREFTANVSHELKTPLQSISGCAEIIQNGLVKQEDIPRFVSQIYGETQHLIALVEDILRLSRLDESSDSFECEEVDLFSLAQETAERLTPVASRHKVRLSVSGEKSVLNGCAQLLTEILYNLCDNAIKYNHEGGSVNVVVARKPTEVVLTVEDTGIGISKEHQRRIFERFYRVDKSHSKETGGTGLGLSIVKHAALFHHAGVEVDSKTGKGTKITVRFPVKL